MGIPGKDLGLAGEPLSDKRLVEALGGGEAALARALLRKRGPAAIPLLVGLLSKETGVDLALDLLFELSDSPGSIAVKAWPLMSTSARLSCLERLRQLAPIALEDRDERVRRVAVRILLRQGRWDPAWVEYLHLRPGADGWTGADLVLIARNLRKKRAVDALESLANTDDPAVLREVALGLAEAGDARAIVPLIRTAAETDGAAKRQALRRLRNFAVTSTPDFALAALRHPRESVRLWAAGELRGVEDPRAIGPLLAFLEDPAAACQIAAIGALARFAGDPRVMERLIGCLGVGDLSVRQAAIEALGEAKAVAAVPALLRALENGFLRPKARAALQAMKA
jgi:HEAT repeat protein